VTPTNAELPIELYRFRTFGASWAKGADKEAVYDLLKSRIRFARLLEFNDPFEGRPFSIPAFKDAGKQRQAVRRYIYQIHRSEGISPGESWKKADDFLRGKTQSELVDWANARLMETNASDGLLICCLSGPEAVSAPLTWSHYADHHRGVAIHFCSRMPPFNFSFPVIYSDQYPEVIFPRTYQDPWEHTQRSFFSKCSLWSYEHEFRIVKVEWPVPGRNPTVSALQVRWEGVTAVAPARSVTGVTVGARMEPAVRADLIARIDSDFPHLEVWQAKLHRSKYEIVRERIK
jgi:hypothetical protein